ncbi:hypothetical protein Tco_0442028 [Tanacetum coccineum]
MAGDKRSFLSKEDLTGKICQDVYLLLTSLIILLPVTFGMYAQLMGSPSSDSSPAIVMDDSCIVDNDLSCSLMGKIKDINALSNIYVIFADEGFDNVNISYLGGFWILIEACSVAYLKRKLLNHEGLASWFSELCIADPSFVSEDRLVWISIEGLPFNTWNNNAYAKIISQWGAA